MNLQRNRFKRFREENDTSCAGLLSPPPTQQVVAVDYLSPLEELLLPTQSKSPTASSTAPLSTRALMDTVREQGLSRPLSTSSLGFRLLQRVGGYQAGQGLGKDEQGITEPLAVQRKDKADVLGIGIVAARARRTERLRTHCERHAQLRRHLQQSFCSHLSRKHASEKLAKDVVAVLKVLYELDRARGWYSHEWSSLYGDFLDQCLRDGSGPGNCDNLNHNDNLDKYQENHQETYQNHINQDYQEEQADATNDHDTLRRDKIRY
jgi:hypothetical protein